MRACSRAATRLTGGVGALWYAAAATCHRAREPPTNPRLTPTRPSCIRRADAGGAGRRRPAGRPTGASQSASPRCNDGSPAASPPIGCRRTSTPNSPAPPPWSPRGARRGRPGSTFRPSCRSRRICRQIAAALQAHQVVVVCGETGSGKTTQLAKLCLHLGRGVHGRIGHTQPRRIAARAVAARLAVELARAARGRLQRAFRRHGRRQRRHPGADRRPAAGARAVRSAAAGLRHADHRRSARAQPEHRFSARLPAPPAAAAAGPAPDHHVGHHRPAALCAALRRRADHRGLRPRSSGRNALPPAAHAGPGPGRPHAGRGHRRRRRRAAGRRPGRRAGVPARRAGNPRRDRGPARRTAPPGWNCCRCTPACRAPSRTACSRPPGSAAWCWPPTWPRPR